jgi:hypothetical protein
MAVVYKVLGQVAPSATSASAVYTVPSATEAVVSTISVCNRGASSGSFRLSVRPDGASLADQHYLVYDADVAANDTLFLTIGATLDAADVLEVYASASTFSFTAFGSEIA